jgi:Protein of unknown function (DUF2809)
VLERRHVQAIDGYDLRASRPRARTLGVLVLVVALGLASRHWAGDLPAFVAAYAGDTLWAAMVFQLAAWGWPAARTERLALGSWLVSVGVEMTQLYHTPWLDAVRATRIGGLVLGYGFRWSDLVCYTAGVVGAALLDRRVGRGSTPGIGPTRL